ncbi:MAG: dienelactone hydrolase family protein [Nevskia sp.]|nr:dienelactone hydrolase family protein [Nevskia sp.]
MPIADYAVSDFSDGGIAHPVYKRGGGPGVVVIHELPGLSDACIGLADEIAAQGFTVYLPLLFGKPGEWKTLKYLAYVCVSREFHLLANCGSSPVVDWLRALCRKARAECPGKGVGAIGMCFTGNFAISLMADDEVLAPVASQPSQPMPLSGELRRHPGVSSADLERAVARSREQGVELMCLRFSSDPYVPRERYEALRQTFGPAFRAIEIDSSPGNPHGISSRAHSMLTHHFVDRQGHPTREARDRVIAFFKEKL